jgi:hypothetical protein
LSLLGLWGFRLVRVDRLKAERDERRRLTERLGHARAKIEALKQRLEQDEADRPAHNASRSEPLFTLPLAVAPEGWRALVAEADRLAGEGRWGEAADRYHEIAEARPENLYVLKMLAQCLARLEDRDGEIEACRRALQLQPENERFNHRLSQLLAGPASSVPSPKLRVWLGRNDKHVFRHLDDQRFDLMTGRTPAEAPDVVLFPSSQDIAFVREADQIPNAVWSKVREGRGVVLFDASLEGRLHDPQRSQALHWFAQTVGAPPGCCIYLTQDRSYARDYGDWCRSQGVSLPMQILNYDYWIRRFLWDYEKGGRAAYAERLEGFRARPRSRQRRFVSLNQTPRPTKTLFVLRLMRDGLWDQGFVSFGGFERVRVLKNRGLAEVEKELRLERGFGDLADDLAPQIQTLHAKGPILFGGKAGRRSGLQFTPEDEALEEYAQSWFSVVTETEMLDRPSRITEKPLKALFNFHPLIVLGNPGSLKLIRDLGFQTFPELFDESYDEEPDPRRRFDMVYAEVERFCRMDEADLAGRIGGITETLEFNARWGMTELPRIYRQQNDADLLRRLSPPAGARRR